MKRIYFILTLICLYPECYCQNIVTSNKINEFFVEIKKNTKDHKSLWNTDLYGPILFVEPKSRVVYSNYPDSSGILKQEGEIFSGILPANINVANTALNWAGRCWAMIMLPLPENKQERLDLLSHELFHRSQALLGFKLNNPENNHLEQKEGRMYLLMELEALRQALLSKSKSEENMNLANALYLRNHRYKIYPNARLNENYLELNEGLATYTGIIMSGRDEIQLEEYFTDKINEFHEYPTFVRSFAYLTTPLYGVILKKSISDWNLKVDSSANLTDFFIKSFGIDVPDDSGMETLNKYGYSKINQEETIREEKINQLKTEYRERFIEQPHLEISLEKMSISFDPRNIMPIEGYGNVYPTLRLTDNWGILTVTNGALLGTNWNKITVSEPTSINKNLVTGNGWTLELIDGYSVQKNVSDNNYSLRK
jgi:hypothetical protein